MEEPTPDDKLFNLLNKQLRTDYGDCPFVVDRRFESAVLIENYNGGRDATYVFVSRGAEWSEESPAALPTIRFAPFVPGTSIIYDVTDATLQGKARPFACDLRKHHRRIYAVLPVQIEAIKIGYQIVREDRQARVSFHDARGEQLEAVCPFEIQSTFEVGGRSCVVTKDAPKLLRTTAGSGEHNEVLYGLQFAPGTQTFLVRSLMTGREHKSSFSAWRTVVPVEPPKDGSPR